jgi:hypothetical protein
MPALRIVPRNFHDEATLTTELSSVPGSTFQNTQNCIRSRVWQSVGPDDQYLLGSFDDGLDRTITFFGMFNHRCHGGSVQLQLYSDAGWVSLVYDSGPLPAINVVPTDGADWGINPYGAGSNDPFLLSAPFWIWVPETTFLSYKISFSGCVSTYGADYWQVERFFMGQYIQAAYPPDFGATLGFVDQSDRNRSRGGSLRTNVGPIWRVMQMDLVRIDEDQRAAWLDIWRYCGTGRDIVVSLYSEDGTRLERDHLMNAKLVALDVLNRNVAILTSKLQIEEV